jgi:tRNA dimethylallyltransferase
MQRVPKAIAIVGPTASGKTKLALGLAKEFDGEIIAVDSRTMYRGMDIGTAKPTEKEQRQIPHYMLDVANPDKALTASQYQKLVTEMIFEISYREKIPFLVGGTGLYLDAIVYGFQMPPEGNPALRIQLEKLSLEELVEKFQKLDPVGSKKIDTKNKRRLIRAVEVCLLTGQPFSKQKKKTNPGFETLL